jgi:maltooligosyltrehalose trehalohydrolase
MARFRVWAPRARAVEVALAGQGIPMAPEGAGPAAARPGGWTGWWRADVESAGAGTDYAFRVDGGPALPDPRSPWQPAGVHWASRVVDHGAFAWTDARWQPPPLAAGVVYELHVGTFTPAGTFAGVIERLDHLVALGVTHVELMPVAEFSGRRGWGYDGVALYAPHEAYGGPVGLKRLVDACHARGLAVLLDVVYNHLGPTGNYLARFGPYFTDRYATPWGDAVNLDGRDSDEVRRFFCDNACMWLRDYHLDGLRLDAVHALLDRSAIHFLEELASEVKALGAHLGRHLTLVAESDLNDPRLVRSPAVGGYGLDLQWNEDFHHALHALLTGERSGYYADFGTLADLTSALRHGFAYAGRFSPYRGRRHGRPATGLSGHQLVGCLQNHDQVGNRARGERIGHLVTPGRLRIGAALVLTSPFVPLLFQGEEWGASAPFQYFTDHDEPALAEAVRTGRRREFAAFGWDPEAIPDPQDPETFHRSRLDWSEVDREPHRSLLDWYRQLIRLRRTQAVLTDGRMAEVCVATDEEASWLVVERGPVTVAANLAPVPRRLPVRAGRPSALLLGSEPGIALQPGGVDLPAESVAILGEPAGACGA